MLEEERDQGAALSLTFFSKSLFPFPDALGFYWSFLQRQWWFPLFLELAFHPFFLILVEHADCTGGVEEVAAQGSFSLHPVGYFFFPSFLFSYGESECI